MKFFLELTQGLKVFFFTPLGGIGFPFFRRRLTFKREMLEFFCQFPSTLISVPFMWS